MTSKGHRGLWVVSWGRALGLPAEILLVLLAALPVQANGTLDHNRRAERLAHCGGFLEGVSVDRKQRLWVLDVTGGRILEVVSQGRCIERAHTGGHPNGAKVRMDGKLLIADARGLLLFDPETFGLEPVDVRYDRKPLTGLNDLSLDRDGGVYITVPGQSDALNPTGRVFYRDPQGAVTLLSDRLAFPNGIAVGPDGETIFVSEFATKRVLALPAVGATNPVKIAYVAALVTGGIGADGIFVDAHQRLLTANFGTRDVQMFAKDGTALPTITLPDIAGAWVTNLTIDGQFLYITEAHKGEVWRIWLDR